MSHELLTWADPLAIKIGEQALAASVQGAAAFCLVWLASRKPLRLPPAVRSLLWALVCLKLCLGLFWFHPVSLPWLPAPKITKAQVAPVSQKSDFPFLTSSIVPIQKSNLPPANPKNPSQPAVSSVILTPPVRPFLSALPTCFLIVWLIAAIICLVRDGAQYLRIRQITRQQTPASEWLIHEAALLAQQLGLRRAPRLALSPNISAPMVCGLFRPVILLPIDFGSLLSPEERAMALAHEMAHLRRGDLWLSGLLSLTRALFVFHPLAWMAVHECLIAREEACDQVALHVTAGGRARYAGLLLKMAGRGVPRLESIGAAGFSAAFYSLRRRLTALEVSRPRTRLGTAFCLIGALASFPWRLTMAAAAVPIVSRLALNVLTQGYRLDDLGGMDGHGSYAAAINDSGTVVGDVVPAKSGGHNHAFLWNAGQISSLDRIPSYRHALATGLNNRGEVVASAYNWSRFHHAFVWDGAPERLPASGSFHFSKALGINDAGQVVGWVQTGRRGRQGMLVARACLWQDDKRHDLGTLGGDYSYAYAINATGAVVGKADLSSESVPETHAFLWQSGQMQDLGTLGGRNSVAYSVSSTQQVAGASETADGTRHAFVWAQGQMQDLGTLPGDVQSVAKSISASGLIVGSSEQENGHQNAVLWANGHIINLNTLLPPNSGWTLTEARGINAHGQIVGEGRWHGQERAFLLTPLHLK